MKNHIYFQAKSLLTLVFLFNTLFCVSQTTQTFTSSGTFTVPAGVTNLSVDLWGAGGGGSNRLGAAGAGGGGAFTRAALPGLSGGQTMTVTVGIGGAVGLPTVVPGNYSRIVIGATTVNANGGLSVNNSITGGAGGTVQALGGVITIVKAGGKGGNARASTSGEGNEAGGGGGGSATSAAAGTAGATGTGVVNVATLGGGGQGAGGQGACPEDGAPDATAGIAPGGGGGGRGEGQPSFGIGGGTSKSGANGQVTVNWVCPSYALTSAATATGPFCGASTSVVTLRSTSLPSGTYTVTYDLAGATVSTGNTATMTFTAGSPGTGTFTTSSLNVGATNITITNLASGSGCLTTISSNNTASVTVNPILPASVAISASATTICSGTNVTYTAVPTNGGASPSYQWQLNGTNVGTNSTTYSNSALVNGDIVTCVLTSNATPCLTGSPATSNTITMTVNPYLPASVAISASATTICSGTNVTFTAVPTNGGASPSYQWKLNGVNVGTNSTTYTNNALANGDLVTCVLTSNATPCLTGSPATSNTITMTVNPNLPASVAISASATTICDETSVTFTAVPTNGGASPSYQWKLNGTNVGTDSATYSNNSLANGDLVTCVLTSNATPCLTGSPATSNTITMTVNPYLPASVSISASATTICDGTSVTFTAVPTNGGVSPSYQWKLNGTNVGTDSATYSNNSLANGDLVTCVLTSNATPCLTGSPATSNTVTMTINPNLPASISISASATTICTGTSVTFTATPTNGGASPSYQWKLNGTNVGINSATYTKNTLANGDIITCVLTSNATPCLTDSPATSNTVTMVVISAPTSVAGTAITTCSTSGAINITAGASATNQTDIIWSSSGTGIFANETSLTTCTYEPSVADIAAGSIILTLTANGNAPCGSTTSTKTLTISNPMTVDSGTAITTCSNSGAVNITTGSSATNQTSITWSSSGTGTFANANSLTTCTYTPSVSDISSGNITLTLTASNSGCSNVTSSKIFTITPLPNSVAGSTITTCSNSGAVNITAGSSATNQTSITWSSSGTGTFANETSLTTCTYTPSAADITAGSVTLTLTANGNAPCGNVTSTKTLTITPLPTSDAGTTITTCSNSGTVNITAGSSATNQNSITWSTSGSGTFANANSLTTCTYTPSATDISSGSVTLTLTANGNAPCGNVTSTKTLTITPLPTSDAGTAITTCSNSGAVNITAGSSATNQSSITWSSNGSGTFANANSLTTCTYTPSTTDISTGSVTLTLTANGNASCGNVSSTKTLTITPLPTSDAGTAITTCSNSGAVNITSGSGATNQSNVTWSSSGSGTFANANSLTNCTYTPSAADISSGSITLTLTASNLGCANITSTKTLTINTLPTSVAGTTIITCSNSGAVNITAGSSASNQSSITWTSNGSGTFANTNSLTTCTYTPSVSDISSGNITLTLTANGNTSCGNVSSTKTLTVNILPTSVAGTAITTCSSSGAVNITVGSSATNQNSIIWSSSGSGTFANANSLTTCTYTPSATDISSGGVTLTLTASNGGCVDVTSTKTLTITEPLTSIAGTAITACSNAGAVNITAGSSAINQTNTIWSSSGTGTFANATSLTTCTYTPSASDISSGNITLILTASNGGCVDVTSTKTLTISNPMTAFAGTDITTCTNSGSINITNGSSATNQTAVVWTSNGTGTFSNANSLTTCTYTPSAADNTAGNVTLTLTVSNASCNAISVTKTLTIVSPPSVVAGTTITTCATTGGVNITAGSSATNQTNITWTSSGSGTFANETSLTNCTYTPSATDISSGSVTLTLTASNAGCSNTSTKTLLISTLPTSVAGTAITTCSSSGAVNITAGSSATNQTNISWLSSGTGTFSNATSLTTCTYAPSATDITAGNITLTLSVSNAGCTNITSTKAMTISSPMIAVAGTAISTCSSSGAVNITAGSSATNQTNITWTSSGTGTFTNATSLTTCTYTPSVTDISSGSVILTLTTSNAGCTNVTATKTLTISSPMTANAGANIDTCSSLGTINITAGSSATNQTSIAWSSSGTGTFTNANSLTTCTYTPSVADKSAGSVILTLTASNGGCVNVTSTKTMSIAPLNTAITVGANQSSNNDLGFCSALITVPNVIFDDNCSSSTLSFTLTGATTAASTIGQVGTFTFNKGVTTINYTVTHFNNTTTAGSKTITVLDNTPPTLTAGANQAVNTDAGVCTTSVAVVDAAFNDNCSGSTISYTLSGATIKTLTSGQVGTYVFNKGITTISYTVTDSSNNTTIGIKTITVTDATAPTLTVGANQAVNTDTGVCTATVVVANATFGDNCSGSTISYILSGATIKTLTTGQVGTYTFNKGITTITYTVTDASGNPTIGSKTITVTDATAPTLTVGANQVVNTDLWYCSASVTVTDATFNDNCTGSTISYTLSGATTKALTSGQVGTSTFNKGITTINYTVTDASANTITGSKTITVNDTQLPTLTVGANQTVITDAGLCSATVAVVNAIFNDNCNVSISYTLSGATTKSLTTGQVGTYTFNKGITTIDYTVTDDSNNTITDYKTITVIDTELPTITSLPTITQDCSVTISQAPTSPDNCGTITGVTSDITLPYTYDIPGFYIIGWNFTDAAGNSKNISQTIIVTDINAPVPTITNLPTINFSGCEILSSQITYPTAMDNCNGLITGVPDIEFPYGVLGTSTITWTYTDDTGNTSYQDQKIIMTSLNINGGVLKGYITSSGISSASTEISITPCTNGGNEVKMNLSGQTGTIIQWEKYEVGNKIWVTIPNTTNTYTVTFYPTTTESTYFRALVNVGNCYQYSNSFYVRALPADLPPKLDQSLYNICLGQQVTLTARRGYTINEDAIAGQGGDFNQGQLNTQDPNSWLVDGNPGGFTAGGNNTKPRNWSGTNNHTFGAITYDSEQLKFSITSGNQTVTTGANKYTGANPTTLESPIFSLANMSSASVDFDQAYYFATGDTAIIYVSTDGGVTYSVLKTMHASGAAQLDWYHDTNVTPAQKAGATATAYNFKNDNTSIPLTAYLGKSKVRIKWAFRGTNDNSVWAMDGITIPVKPKLDKIEWTDGIGDPGTAPISLGQLESSFTYTPEAPGSHTYGATVLVDGCRSYDESGAALASVNVNYAYAGSNIILTPEECGSNTVQLNAYDNSKSANQNAVKGAYTIPTGCITCEDPGTNTVGVWSVTGSSTCGTGTFSNINDPDAIFTGEVGNYILTWTVSGCQSSVNVTITNCDKINFDGNNDYVDFKKENYNLNGDFSIEAWVKTAVTSNNIQTIFSKRNANVNGNGYDLRIQNDFVIFRWNGTGSMTSPYKITPNKWYHITVTHTNSEYKLYVDGILVNTATGASSPILNNYKSLLGAMDQDNNAPNKPVNYLNGSIDEFKIWDVSLTEEQIHQMMNQEIKEQSTGNNVVYGEVIPMVINGLTWSNLKGYYRMDQTSCGYLKPNFGVGLDGKLKNTTSAESQTAPLPYYSVRNGNWTDTATSTPWAYGDTVWNYPNSKGINGQYVNWNIVRSLHDIDSTTQDITLLGLKVESGKITIANSSQSLDYTNNGKGLWVTHYLQLNGFIDLIGKSQLLQKKYNPAQISESILEATSSGYIERDQQGQPNQFNYNYWSSPVSPINSTSNNTNYSVSNVMKDGTTTTPQNINWVGGLDGSATSPISLARRWLYKFDNYANTYANWVQITENGLLRAGQGFIFKGPGATTTNQNYTFKGKPNNGTIAGNTVSSDQLLLTGNPYPSALNANKFISDNINSIDGTLYFWDHYTTNNTHVLHDYQGGYGVKNLTGGIAPVAPSLISGRGSSSKIPAQYIPVGQGFFVNGKIGSGGTVTFNNEQRGFYKEDESGVSTTLFKTAASTKKLNNTDTDSSIYDPLGIEQFKKIRLGFNSNNNYHRQLLLGFMEEKATSGIDAGYDALNIDNFPNDMYFLNGENQLVIQGVGFFDTNDSYPIGVKTNIEGKVSFAIDGLENFDPDQPIYIYDKVSDTYHDVRNENFEVNMPIGVNDSRFSLRFTDTKTLKVDSNTINDIQIKHIQNENMLVINNNLLDLTVEKVTLFNILGQSVANWKVGNQEQKNIQIPIKNISAGVYIAKIKTSNGNLSKKIIIN